MALAGSLCCVVHAVSGFTNKSLRGLVAGLLGRDYSSSQMSYDLRRLRLHGLIERRSGTNTYVLTAEGLRVAVFYTKLESRLLKPLLGRDYSSSQMSYDLRRLRLHGLIERRSGTNTYVLTAEGLRVAVFYTKLESRLLKPLLEADCPPAPIELRRALTTIEHVLGDCLANARLGAPA